jgi:MoaA/NifB/PqqE/SkfB family radical SAM enzyme
VSFVISAPQYVSWNYTYRCNFNCDHCYSRAPSYPEELPADAYLHIADQLVEAQVFTVALGGGEVVMRRDCLAVLARLGDAGIETMLTTNGWFVDDRLAAQLRDAGLWRLYVSLDSPRVDEHDAFRNRRGSYVRVRRALCSAVRAGLDVYLSTVLTAHNVEDLDGFVALAEQEGLTGINFKRFRPAGNGLRTRDQYELRDGHEAMLRERLASLKQVSALDISLNYGPEPDTLDAGCSCGVQALAIRPNGDVAPCSYGEQVIGNLTRQSLAELWRHSPELQAMRATGGCLALSSQPRPSNPYLREGMELLPVLNVARSQP